MEDLVFILEKLAIFLSLCDKSTADGERNAVGFSLEFVNDKEKTRERSF